MSDRACENCGFVDEDLVMVRRVYVVPETWEHPTSHTVVPGAELWCVSCVSQYPCEPAEEEPDEAN